jgi:AcrR family transcriptional regulator
VSATARKSAKLNELPPRERILRVALELFYRHGVNSVGVDRIIAESGVAKMTFYRHFPTKCKLIAEYLGHMDKGWRELLEAYAGDEAKPALERLLAIFDALKAAIECPDFHGCAFTKALAEFGPERDEPEIRARVDRHFSDLETFVARLLKEIRPRDARKLTQPLVSLICGTIVVAQATGKTDVAAKNKEAAKTLLAE